jgi:thiopeptide-type bacteriocin biosynthesis protein
LSALLFGHPDRFDEILTGHLPGLITAVGEQALAWWFQRQAGTPSTGPHIAVCLTLPDLGGFGPVGQETAAWADGLRRERLLSQLTLTVDDPQAGLLGGGLALDAAHRVLAADSTAAIAQLAFAQGTKMGREAVAAASMTDLAALLASSPVEGMSWLAQVLPREHGAIDRVLREQALRLADPAGGPACGHLAALPTGADLAAAWERRAAAIADYQQHLTGQGGPEAVLPFLLKEHQGRATGTGAEVGRVTRHLARACALRYLATREPRELTCLDR